MGIFRQVYENGKYLPWQLNELRNQNKCIEGTAIFNLHLSITSKRQRTSKFGLVRVMFLYPLVGNASPIRGKSFLSKRNDYDQLDDR